MMNTKRKLRELTTVVGSILTCFIILSCSFSDDFVDMEDVVGVSSSSAPVNFNFTVSTRATADDSTAVSTFETQIKDADGNEPNYRIYFFDSTDHTYLCSFTPDYFSSTTTGSNTSYSVSGTLAADTINYINEKTKREDEPDSVKFTVVFIANWNEYPTVLKQGETTIDQLCEGKIGDGFDAKFICPTITSFDDLSENYMPFYGVKVINCDTLKDGERVNLGDISLLRAMAKVTVVNVTQTQNRTRATYYPEIYDVSIIHHNDSGYCAPYQVYTDSIKEDHGYMIDDENHYYVNQLHLPYEGDSNKDWTGNVDQDTIKMFSFNDSTWIAYIPEYKNTEISNADTCYIRYKVRCYGDKDTSDDGIYTHYYSSYNNVANDSATISFSSYTKGKITDDDVRYDIKRNKSYTFDVSLPKVFKLSAITDEEFYEDDSYEDVEGWYVKRKPDD